MATRFWSAPNDLYSESESEEELDDVAVDTFEEKLEQDYSLHGTKYEESNKNTVPQKTMKWNRPSFFARFQIDAGCGFVVHDVVEAAIEPVSEDEDVTRDYALEEWRSLRNRYLKMCEEIDLDATLDEKRIIIPEKNRKYELLKREGATPYQMIRVFLMMIRNHMSTLSVPHGGDPFCGHMPFKAWKKCVEDLYVVLEILKGSDIVIGMKKGLRCYKGKTFIFGNLIESLEEIDIHLLKRLQCVDLGPQELVEVLRNECILYDLCQNFQQYFVSIKDYRRAAKSALIMMAIVYYKNTDMYDLMRKIASVEADVQVAATPGFGTKSRLTFPENCLDLMYELACFIAKHGGSATITHATLCYMYNLAIMDQYLEAANILCDSGLSKYPHHMSVATTLLYNRTLAQLGLCSLRVGCTEEAHEILHDFQNREWSKKLLKQGKPGKSLPYDDIEKEFYGRSEQMPPHMHINLEHLQLGYQLCDELLSTGSRPKGAAATEVKLTGIPKDVEDHTGVVMQWDFSKLSNLTEPPDFWMLRQQNNSNQSHLLSDSNPFG